MSTASVSFTPSGVTISSASVSAMMFAGRGPRASSGRLHLGGGCLHVVEVAAHVEGLLGQIVESAREDLLEAGDGFLERDVAALAAGELRRHEERLREEALDPACARD